MGTPKRTEKLTPEKLFKFYKPPGINVPEEEWERLLTNSSWTRSSKVVVHVILTDISRKRFALVVNAADRDREGKLRGIGIPTKEALDRKTPFETAAISLKDKLNISKFELSDHPILIRKNSREVIHIVFTGTADFPESESKIIKDSHKEVWQAFFINPFRSIKIESKGNGERIFKTVLGTRSEKRYVYKSHLGMISFFLESKNTKK